jgi:type I restriction enzyme, S subunit
MSSENGKTSVIDLQEKGILLVEDGNHGEYRPLKNEFCEIGTAFIRAADLGDGEVGFGSAEKINTDATLRIRKGIGKEGDVLISHKGTLGKIGFVREGSPPFVCSPQTTFWRVLNEQVIDRYYLFAYMRSPQFKRVFSVCGGETDMAPYVSLTSQRLIELRLPQIGIQRAIGEIVRSLDDKIELNRKTNETLEAMAKALFKSWFVDFDPVRAKAEGRPTGLPAEISDLFPDSFEDSELGEIPKGWEVKALDEIAHFLNGLALQKFPPEDGAATLPVIKIAQLKKGDSTGADRCSTAVPSDYVVRDGDVLFSWSGSLAVDIWCGGDGALNQHLFKVTSKTYGKWFFYQWVKHHLPVFQEIAQGKATTMGHIQRHHLSGAKVLIPPPSLLAAMDSAFTALLDRAFGLRRQSKDLGSFRDTLLPKLISGEIRIPDAEKMLEEVGV